MNALSYSARMDAERASRLNGTTAKAATQPAIKPKPVYPATAEPISTPKVTDPPQDFAALAVFHIDQMQRLAAVGKAKDIIWNFAPSLLTLEDQWDRLPEASRRVLSNYQAAGGGQFVPKSL